MTWPTRRPQAGRGLTTIAVGAAGNVVGAGLGLLGLYGGRPPIDRYGRYVHLRHEHNEPTERWFA